MTRALTCLLVLLSCRVSLGVTLAGGPTPEFIESSALYQICSKTDFDNDGDTDGHDFLRWQRNLGIVPPAAQMLGDANNDFTISSIDLQLWKARIGTPPPTIADAVCFKLFLDPTGVILGQVTAFIDVPNVGPGDRLLQITGASAFVATHPQYQAQIVGPVISTTPGRQRYEAKITFNSLDLTNPPEGQIDIFQLELLDAKPQLGVGGILLGFRFDPGDTITVFDNGVTTTFNDMQLQGVNLSLAIPLVLDVNTVLGTVTMRNLYGLPLDINAYQIASATQSLDPNGWVSFDDAEMDPPGLNWVESSAAESSLAESNAMGSTAFSNGQSVSLGTAYNPAGGATDLTFFFRRAGEATFTQGKVNYFASGGPVQAIPEPGCLALASVGFAWAAFRRGRTRRRSR